MYIELKHETKKTFDRNQKYTAERKPMRFSLKINPIHNEANFVEECRKISHSIKKSKKISPNNSKIRHQLIRFESQI